MALTKGKHVIVEIEGVRCSVAESGVSKERCEFLSDLLRFNKFEVKISEDKKKAETDPTVYTVAVTDIMFNPVIVVYQKKMKTKEGRVVNPAFWNQWDLPNNIPYWMLKK